MTHIPVRRSALVIQYLNDDISFVNGSVMEAAQSDEVR
jgi:hypothetical protein